MAKKKSGSVEPPPQSAVVAQEIVFEYKKVMEEDGLAKNDLPKGIKSQIQVLDAQTAKYKKNPTENLLNSVRTQDVKIADQIHSFIEEGIVEQTEEDKLKQQQQMENEEKEKLAAAEKEKAEKETAEKETAEATAKAKDAEEAAVKAKNEADELAAKEKAAADKKEREGAFGNPFLKGMLGQ